MDILRRHPRWTALAAFALLAVALSSPRLLGASFYAADDWHDVEIFFWDFWWLGEALRSGQNPWFSTMVFHPGGTSLGFHPTGFFYGLLSLPLQAMFGAQTGVILAYNLITLSSLTLAGWFTFLVARRLEVGWQPAFLAGMIYSFSAYHFWHLGRLHVGGIEMLPLFLLALLEVLESPRRPWRAGLLAGGAGVLLLYTSLTNFSSAILLTVTLVTILAAGEWRLLLRRPVVVASLVTAAIIVLAALPFIHAWLVYPSPVSGARSVAENADYSADLAGYVIPGHNSTVYGGLAPYLDARRQMGGQETFTGLLPWLLLPLAFMVAPGQKPWRWFIMAAVFGVLSLGPFLKVLGYETGVPLPYRLFYEVVPLLKVNRTPVRYAAPFLLFLALLAAQGAHVLSRRKRRAWVMPVLLVAALAESVFALPLTAREQVPAIYEEVAASAGSVINVPLYHARLDRRLMYHQIFHQRPVTSACIPRASETPHKQIEGTGLRACLVNASACERVEPAVVGAEIRERQVGWILVHSRFQESAHGEAIHRLLLQSGARRHVVDPAGISAYQF